jgi:hypothetical protein
MGFQGPQAVDFYSQLSGLGDIIAKNRDAQAKRDAFAAATTPGPDGKIDYGRAILGLAQVDPQSATLFASRQNHEDALKQHSADQAIAERHFQANYGLQKQAADRAKYEFDNTPDQYVPNPNAGQPGQPQFIDQYAAATAASGGGDSPAAVKEYKYYRDNFAPSETQKAPIPFDVFRSQGKGTASGTYSQDMIDNLTDRLAAGDNTWKTGLARAPGLISQVEENAAKRATAAKNADPNVNPSETLLQNRANQAGRVAEQRTLGTATASNTLYGNTAAQAMQTAVDASAKVPRTSFVPLNRIMLAAESNISDPDLKQLKVATNTLVNEYAKATTPVGKPTDDQRHHAYELLRDVDSHPAFVATVNMMRREIANTHRGDFRK